jgi:hypothetical protein
MRIKIKIKIRIRIERRKPRGKKEKCCGVKRNFTPQAGDGRSGLKRAASRGHGN